MDPQIAVGILGLAGVIVSGGFGAYIALNTNKAEKRKVAEHTVESTLRERMAFRDEKLAFKDEIISEQREEIDELREEVAARDLVIRELREQLNPGKASG